MGLPMFREPDEAIAIEAAAKLDRAAAAQRSSIRRQSTVRSSRLSSTSAARERIREHRRDHDRHAELQIAQLEAELARLRNQRQQQRAQDLQSSSQDTVRESDLARFRNRMQQRALGLTSNPRDARDLVEQSRDIFRSDEENLDRAPSPIRRHPLPRPNRESNLRFQIGASRSSSVSPRQLRLLSPPSSSGSGRNVPDGPLDDTHPTLTPGFAPARGAYDTSPEALDTPPPESWDISLPPLGRMTGRETRPSRFHDGLGDRTRSPSPDRDAAAEEETWANILATMDTDRSSTATSFASNIDSGARNSQATVATSFGEIGPDDGCDLDLPSGITDEIARAIRDQHRSRNREPDGPIMTGEQGLRMHRERTRRNNIDRQHERTLRRAHQVSSMLQTMERFGNRDDIPDDWWPVLGYDPTLRSPAESSSSTEGILRPSRDDLRQTRREMQEVDNALHQTRTRNPTSDGRG